MAVNLEQMAAAFFANSMPQTEPAPQATADAAPTGLLANARTGDEEPPSVAEQMFGEKPAPDASQWIEPAPAELEQIRREDAGIYDRTGPYGAVKVGDLIDQFQPGLPPEAIEAAQVEVRHWLADAGLTPVEAGEVTRVARELMTSPPDDGAVQQMQADAWKLLREHYNDQAETALRRAQALVQRDPRLVRTLEQTGLGNHPTVILRLAQQAQREVVRGRLKV